MINNTIPDTTTINIRHNHTSYLKISANTNTGSKSIEKLIALIRKHRQIKLYSTKITATEN